MNPQEEYDEAMFAFSKGDFDEAIAKLKGMLAAAPGHFDAQLALGMAYYRKGDYPAAIAEGHKAEALRPLEQLVHTNLSLYYMKSGDKKTAEHHGLQARIASWREDAAKAKAAGGTAPPPPVEEGQLRMAVPKMGGTEGKAPEMPWKKNKQN